MVKRGRKMHDESTPSSNDVDVDPVSVCTITQRSNCVAQILRKTKKRNVIFLPLLKYDEVV